MNAVSQTFNVGEHGRWNSEPRRVTGIIIKKISSDIKVKGYTHHTSREEP